MTPWLALVIGLVLGGQATAWVLALAVVLRANGHHHSGSHLTN